MHHRSALEAITNAMSAHLSALERAILSKDEAAMKAEVVAITEYRAMLETLGGRKRPEWHIALLLLVASLCIVSVLSLLPVRSFNIHADFSADRVWTRVRGGFMWSGAQPLSSAPTIWRGVSRLSAPGVGTAETDGELLRWTRTESMAPTLRTLAVSDSGWIAVGDSYQWPTLYLGGGGQAVEIDLAGKTSIEVGQEGRPQSPSQAIYAHYVIPEQVRIVASRYEAGQWLMRSAGNSEWRLYNVPISAISFDRLQLTVEDSREMPSSLESAQIRIPVLGKSIQVGRNEHVELINPRGVITQLVASSNGTTVSFDGAVDGIRVGRGMTAELVRPSILVVLTHALPAVVILTAGLGLWTTILQFRSRFGGRG